MRKVIKKYVTTITRNEELGGTPLERQLEQVVAGAGTIETTIPELIYTEREAGVLPQYDHRADKWELAQETANARSMQHREKRAEKHIKFKEAAEAAKAAQAAKDKVE